MEGKLLSHVEFKFIRNAYPLHEKLFCYFQSPNVSQWQPEVGDWVGLYKVGWNSLNEHRVRKQVQQELLECRKNVNVDYVHVVFEQHELPKEIEGLYQFVYVTKNEVIKGISTAFKFDRVLPQVELRRLVDVMSNKQHQHHQQQQQQEQLLQESIMQQQLPNSLRRERSIERELVKECQRLNLNWGKVTDDAVSGKLMQKYLQNVQKINTTIGTGSDEVTKRVEELFVENGKLCMSLKTRIQEVAELKKECDEMKSCNGELLCKLGNAERKVEQLEREKELNVRRIEDLVRESPRVGLELQGKQLLEDLEQTAKWLLQDDCKEIQPELKSVNSFYGELEQTPIETARIKLVQRIEEPLQQKRGQLIEKILREVDNTPGQIRLLKRVIEDLKCDNEILRERVRQVEGETTTTTTTTQTTTLPCRQEVQVQVQQQQPMNKNKSIIKEVTVLPRISLVPMEQCLHDKRDLCEQRQHLVGSSLPSISVSTIQVPESTLTITGKVEQQQQQQQQILSSGPVPQWQQQQHLRGQVGEYLNRLDEQIRTKIEERLRNKIQEQLKRGEQTTIQRQNCKIDDLIRQNIVNQQCTQQQQPQQWTLNVEELPRWRQVEQQRKLVRDISELTPSLQSTLSTMCPVCGIAMPSELNVCDFEIHFNSHFTD